MPQTKHTRKLDAVMCTTADFLTNTLAPQMHISSGIESEIIQHLYFEIEQAIETAKNARTYVQNARRKGMSDNEIVNAMRS